MLQNYEDLSIKHSIDLVSTEYSRRQKSTWLEKVKSKYKRTLKTHHHNFALFLQTVYAIEKLLTGFNVQPKIGC